MPGFAADLGHGDPGMSYSMLLAAAAAGHRDHAGIIVVCRADGLRAVAQLPAGVVLPVRRGFPELSFNAMAQSLVQLNAPLDMRDRVIGLFNMASLDLRALSRISVGLLGSVIGIHWSLALSAPATVMVAGGLLAIR
jgi:hypothetical protein